MSTGIMVVLKVLVWTGLAVSSVAIYRWVQEKKKNREKKQRDDRP